MQAAIRAAQYYLILICLLLHPLARCEADMAHALKLCSGLQSPGVTVPLRVWHVQSRFYACDEAGQLFEAALAWKCAVLGIAGHRSLVHVEVVHVAFGFSAVVFVGRSKIASVVLKDIPEQALQQYKLYSNIAPQRHSHGQQLNRSTRIKCPRSLPSFQVPPSKHGGHTSGRPQRTAGAVK
jgi:hypothetical protein